jgi:glycosyltransferase involved in cell wall biosynthesis
VRICLITPELPPYIVGGIGVYIETLAAGLGSRGHAVDVVGCDIHPHAPMLTHSWGRSLSLPPAGVLAGSVPKAVERMTRWLTEHNVPGLWRVQPFVSARRGVSVGTALRRYVHKFGSRYDVIEYPNWPGDAAFLPVPSPAIYVARLSTSAADIDESWVPPALERRAVRKAKLVISHSVAMARRGQELYGITPDHLVVIPLGLPDRQSLPPPPDDGRLHLLSVGRAEDRKGTDLLITALSRLLPNYPDVVFRFVGPGLVKYMDRRPDLLAAWDRLQSTCPGRAIDTGRVTDEDRDRLLAASHWMVTPSRFESFGLVAIEAMRAGTPVIYSETGGLTEVGSAGPHNRSVRPDDSDDLIRVLDEVCRLGPKPAVSWRDATRAVYLREFDRSTMVTRTLDAYQSISNGKCPARAEP